MCEVTHFQDDSSSAKKSTRGISDASAMAKIAEIQNKQALAINVMDFTTNIAVLMEEMKPFFGTGRYFVSCKRKSSPCRNKAISKRRSRYTGVTRNSVNYQTLVVINGKKIYAGSFSKEMDAAKCFDFYSLLLRQSKATTNFSYTAEEIESIVTKFVANNGVFDC